MGERRRVPHGIERGLERFAPSATGWTVAIYLQVSPRATQHCLLLLLPPHLITPNPGHMIIYRFGIRRHGPRCPPKNHKEPFGPAHARHAPGNYTRGASLK
jgi:hypothetical protein